MIVGESYCLFAFIFETREKKLKMSVFSPQKRKKDEDGVLSEPIGHIWQTLFDSGEKANVLVCVRGETGGDVMLKVRKRLEKS